ncbi:DNA repair protein RecN, partial [bacterium]|nr:DNA repair protein RecN [bacterium]
MISRAEFELGRGFCVFTGETGAGKSMVLGALAVLVGEKFPANAVKSDAKKAIIEGEFALLHNKDIAQILAEAAVDDAGETMLLRREIAQGGRARCYINDSPVALEVLLALGERLVDLHGQHEQQALLKRGRHI